VKIIPSSFQLSPCTLPRCSAAGSLAVLVLAVAQQLSAQCPHVSAAPTEPTKVEPCLVHTRPGPLEDRLDEAHPYTLSELIDVAESNHPEARIAWLAARAAAERTGLARSEYLPHLAGAATMLNQKLINPFPKPYAPQGYTMVEMPVGEAGLELGYTLVDFGRRHAHLQAARANALAAADHLERANQEVAFRTINSYYRLVNAQEKLTARRQILATAQTIQNAAEAQLANGRATLPDVLDARAGSAKASYELEEAIGEEQTARVALRQSLGVPPSDAIRIGTDSTEDEPATAVAPAQALVEEALRQRPDLAALRERIHAAAEETKLAHAAYWPTMEFNARGASQSLWPTVSKDGGWLLTDTTHFVWETGVSVHWNLLDGGARRSRERVAQAEEEKTREEERETREAISESAWRAWVGYQTAERRLAAATALLTAAESSSAASLEAYNYGVKNLMDVVHAEQQLAEARLAIVEARSATATARANLGYTTGSLLRSTIAPTAATTTTATEQKTDPTAEANKQ